MPEFWDPSLESSLQDLQHNSSLCASFFSSRSLPPSQETTSLPRNGTRNSWLISSPLPRPQLSLHHHGPLQLHLALCSLSVHSNTSELEIVNQSNALRLHSGCGQRSESCLLTGGPPGLACLLFCIPGLSLALDQSCSSSQAALMLLLTFYLV